MSNNVANVEESPFRRRASIRLRRRTQRIVIPLHRHVEDEQAEMPPIEIERGAPPPPPSPVQQPSIQQMLRAFDVQEMIAPIGVPDFMDPLGDHFNIFANHHLGNGEMDEAEALLADDEQFDHEVNNNNRAHQRVIINFNFNIAPEEQVLNSEEELILFQTPRQRATVGTQTNRLSMLRRQEDEQMVEMIEPPVRQMAAIGANRNGLRRRSHRARQNYNQHPMAEGGH